jgi:hypothetical protein
MGLIRFQIDADSGQLKSVERELAWELEEGGTYLIAGSSTEDFLPAERLEPVRVESTAGRVR